jgi:hypothetical protein
MEDAIQIQVTKHELMLLCDALDSHEYWQLGHCLPRNEGAVFVPGDFMGDRDRYWEGRALTKDERSAIRSIRGVRALLERLRAAATPPLG